MHIMNPYRHGGGGGGITDPTDIAGLDLWLDGADSSTMWQDTGKTTAVTTNSDPVANWVDKSANAIEYIQATASARPLYKTSIKNGLSAILLDGVNDKLTKTSPGIFDGDLTAFAVSYSSAASAIGTIITSAGNVGASVSLFNDTRTTPRRAIQYPNSSVSYIDLLSQQSGSTWRYLSVAIDATTSAEAWLDGVSQGSATPTTPTATTSVIGSLAPTTTAALIGYIAEIIVYNSVLSTADRQSVETYLASKWAI